MYEHLKNNQIYKDYVELGNTSDFYEFILATWIAMEDDSIVGPLHFIKFVKTEAGSGLKHTKDWFDMLRDLGFIESDFNAKYFVLKKELKEIRTMDSLVHMIDNQLTLDQFCRRGKLKKVIKRIKSNNG